MLASLAYADLLALCDRYKLDPDDPFRLSVASRASLDVLEALARDQAMVEDIQAAIAAAKAAERALRGGLQ
jgi:hypothetical protein